MVSKKLCFDIAAHHTSNFIDIENSPPPLAKKICSIGKIIKHKTFTCKNILVKKLDNKNWVHQIVILCRMEFILNVPYIEYLKIKIAKIDHSKIHVYLAMYLGENFYIIL